MPELGTSQSMSCPRCRATMDEVVRIEPTVGEMGLIAYECPKCTYVTSVLLAPFKERDSAVKRETKVKVRNKTAGEP
jgi:C4-type Zn-finger protein